MTTPKPDERGMLVDPRVDRAWREASGEEPPASLDAALLAAAHREVGSGPQSAAARDAKAARRQWWPFAAAATVAAITVGVLQLATPDQIGAPATNPLVISDMPVTKIAAGADLPAPADKVAPLPAAPAPPVAEAKPAGIGESRARSDDAANALGDAPLRRTPAGNASAVARDAPAAARNLPSAPEPFPAAPKRFANAVAPPAAQTAAPLASPPIAPSSAPASALSAAPSAPPLPAPPAAPAAAPSAALSAAPALRSELQQSPAPIGNVAAERASAAPAPMAKMAASRPGDTVTADMRQKDRGPLPIPEWIALIRRLRDGGKPAEAEKELAAFRAAHADHEKLLPPDLRDWHPPEK